MFGDRSIYTAGDDFHNREPICFGWKEDIVTEQPRKIYLLNKHCLSCFWYRGCVLKSEEREKVSKDEN
jgi:hypothetical protein